MSKPKGGLVNAPSSETPSPSTSPPKKVLQKSFSTNFFGINKNKGYIEAKKNMGVLEKKTKVFIEIVPHLSFQKKPLKN